MIRSFRPKKARDAIDATDAKITPSSPMPKSADSIAKPRKDASFKALPSWFIGFIAFTAFMLPVALVHETGHVLTCDALGGEGKYVSIFSSDCSGIESKMAIVRYAGGFTAASVCGALACGFRNKWHPGLIISLLAYVAWDGSKGVLEGAAFGFYASLAGDRLMSGIAVGAGLLAWLYFRRRR